MPTLTETYRFKPYHKSVPEMHAGAVNLDTVRERDRIGAVPLRRGDLLTLARVHEGQALVWTVPMDAAIVSQLLLVNLSDLELTGL